jgi:Terpene synthase family 2, C-terminal metal binding
VPPPSLSPHARAPKARDAGRICAVAGQGQRDLQRCAATYPELFPPGPFDPALFSAVCLANAFSAPWLDAARLRLANRAALWAFAVDRRVDVVAASDREVTALVRRCRAVARGDASGDQLGALLAAIRDDLTDAPGRALMPTWRRELSRMLACMQREWRWGHGGPRPTLGEYLDNADNLGLSFVFVSHLIFTGEALTGVAATGVNPGIGRLVAVGKAAQRVIRLVNDLATYERDLATGDLNVLRLGLTRRAVRRQLGELLAECRARCDALRATHPYPVTYVERQVEFNLGFHPVADYWGAGA